MTTVDRIGNKIVLPRLRPDRLWEDIHDHYAHEDHRRWKYLAMLTLYEANGWSLEHIGHAFGHSRGHVLRCIRKIKADLKQNFSDGRPDQLED